MSADSEHHDAFLDQAIEAQGGESSDFMLTVKDCGPGAKPAVALACRTPGCEWGEYVGEMELWEFVVDAREHWESEHAPKRESA